MSDNYAKLVVAFVTVCPGLPSALEFFLSSNRCVCCMLRTTTHAGGKGIVHVDEACPIKVDEQVIMDLNQCSCTLARMDIDVKFVRDISSGDIDVFKVFYARGGYFNRVYANETAVGVGRFGPGYCYLRYFLTKIRHRVARVLGPNPLMADVLRAYLAAGYPNGNALTMRKTANSQYHVVNVRRTYDFYYHANAMLQILCEDRYARLGYDALEVEVEDVDVGGIDVTFESCVIGLKRPFKDLSNDFLFKVYQCHGFDILTSERLFAFRGWFEQYVGDLTYRDYSVIMIILTTLDYFQVADLDALKNWYQLMSLKGELAMRGVVLRKVMLDGEEPSVYTKGLMKQEVAKVAEVYHKCGIKVHVMTKYTGFNKRADAMMLRALIGYVDSVGNDAMVENLVRGLKLC